MAYHTHSDIIPSSFLQRVEGERGGGGGGERGDCMLTTIYLGKLNALRRKILFRY